MIPWRQYHHVIALAICHSATSCNVCLRRLNTRLVRPCRVPAMSIRVVRVSLPSNDSIGLFERSCIASRACFAVAIRSNVFMNVFMKVFMRGDLVSPQANVLLLVLVGRDDKVATVPGRAGGHAANGCRRSDCRPSRSSRSSAAREAQEHGLLRPVR